jgi:hypothetical protein
VHIHLICHNPVQFKPASFLTQFLETGLRSSLV